MRAEGGAAAGGADRGAADARRVVAVVVTHRRLEQLRASLEDELARTDS